MLKELGGVFGWIIVVLYALTVSNYFVKVINKKFNKQIAKNQKIKKIYNFCMQKIVRYHKNIGGLTILFIITHLLIQYSNFGLSITGIVLAILMIGQVFLGAYGSYIKKKRSGLWFITHRIISIVLVIALMIHIL